jgi:periodic tryptophan protein 1
MFGNNKDLAYHESNADDPYITLGGGAPDEEDEDREDMQILATDNLLLAAKVEDDMATLEVFVYEDDADNLYVHHDIMLPAIPLCVEWLDFAVNKQGGEGAAAGGAANFVAVGTMDPEIEIWDLDTVDAMYPNAILGQSEGDRAAEKKSQKKKKGGKPSKKKSSKPNDAYHVDAVLALAANRSHRNLLASASADKTIKLWDLNTARCAKSYAYHADKVCSLAWHATETTMLLSGSYDRTVALADMRAAADAAVAIPRWVVESDLETVRWDPHDPNYFLASTEAGIVHYFDVRAGTASSSSSSLGGGARAVWTLQAHDEAVNAFDVNPVIPGFLATGSVDRTVKLWNYGGAGAGSGPSMVVSRNLDVGKIFAATFAPDAEVAFRLAVAGSKGSMHVWDTSTNAAVRRAFAGRVPGGDDVEERLVGVEDDSDEGDGGEEDSESGEEGQGGESMDED